MALLSPKKLSTEKFGYKNLKPNFKRVIWAQKEPNKKMKSILPSNLTPISSLNFAGLMSLNSYIYLVVNDRHYTKADLVSKMFDFAGKLHKKIRQEELERTDWYVSVGLSWTLALATRMHVKLDEATWSRYPGVCPYCHGRPCLGGKRCKTETVPMVEPFHWPESLSEYQKMFKLIYPKNVALKSAGHLLEEIVEANEALRNFSNDHSEELFHKFTVELVDVAANFLAIPNCLDFSLAEKMEQFFSEGCPSCHQPECQCEYKPMEVK